MRIDKYLKVSRLIKRREVAKEACLGGRILINDRIAKPGSEVKVDDIIDIRLGSRHVQVRVAEIREHVSKGDAATLYEQLAIPGQASVADVEAALDAEADGL